MKTERESAISAKQLQLKEKLLSRDKSPKQGLPLGTTLLVWLARLVVGGVFVVSGFTKAVDPWGSFYKIGEYLTVWGINLPDSLILTAAVALAVWEGLLGAMLLLGCYRRGSVWALLLTMGFLLPLSLYIYIYSPVADCGCFGDFIILSNAQTFYKNVVITAALVWLIFVNKRVMSLISPYIQWTAAVLVVIYLLAVSLIGYNCQPLLDFRSYPEGTSLVSADDEADASGDVEFEFIYAKDGKEQAFSADDLPTDTTWTFVDRRVVSGEINKADRFIIYDKGEDVTDSVIISKGEQLILLQPLIDTDDISFTFYLNALSRYLKQKEGSLIAVIGTDDEGLERWRDLSLANYPLYTAEPTAIKELARGNMALVYLRDGVIQWKRTAGSLDGEKMIEAIGGDDAIGVASNNAGSPLSAFAFDHDRWLQVVTVLFAVTLLFIIFADGIQRFIRRILRRRH